jgi:hypothetical protein
MMQSLRVTARAPGQPEPRSVTGDDMQGARAKRPDLMTTSISFDRPSYEVVRPTFVRELAHFFPLKKLQKPV